MEISEAEKESLSPTSRREIIHHKIQMEDHKLELEDKKYENTWRSCCLVVDRRAVVYLSQMFVIVFAMGFSMYQLMSIHECNGQQAYLGLLTMLIGLLCPNPNYQKK